MTALDDLAMDIVSIQDLKKLPINVVELDAEQLEQLEQDPQKISIDLGPVVISVFHRNCPYLITEQGVKSGWHYFLSTYTHDDHPAGPGLAAEGSAIDKMIQYIRQAANKHGWPKDEDAKKSG
jgi:hypothetical protein